MTHSRAVPAAMRMPSSAAARSVNRTVTVFWCSSIFVPVAPGGAKNGSAMTLQANLVGSTSSLASLRVNGAELAPDRLILGRSLVEFNRVVELHRGVANEVLVKAMQPSWAAPWEMALSLGQLAHAQGGAGDDGAPVPIPGLRSNACGGV